MPRINRSNWVRRGMEELTDWNFHEWFTLLIALLVYGLLGMTIYYFLMGDMQRCMVTLLAAPSLTYIFLQQKS